MIITIGNAIPYFNKRKDCDGSFELIAKWIVEKKTLPEASFYPHDTANGHNTRDVPFQTFALFCEKTGLYHLLFNESDGLVDNTGTVSIAPWHYDSIKAALERWKTKNIEDNCLARLVWLEFWFRWALSNCETPAIERE